MSLRYQKSYLLIAVITSLCAATLVFAGDDATNDASAATPETDIYRTSEVDSFVSEMSTATGWTVTWSRKGKDASKKKYKDDNNAWIDASDIHFHSGHGGDAWDWGYFATKRAIIFKGTEMVPSEAQSSGHGMWGNNDLEWIGLTCCSLLDDKSYKCWAASMDKLHLFLGFKTTSYSYSDGRFARAWVQEMKRKATIEQAWYTATDQHQKAGVVARVLAEENTNFNDHLNNYGSVSADPTPNSTFYKHDHPCASPPYLMVTPPLSTMRVYEVVARDVNTSYVSAIASAFGLGSRPILSDSYYYYVTTETNDPCVLLVHKNSGLYYHYDTSRLWNTAYNLSNPVFPEVQAYSQAESFYAAHPVLYRETRGAYEVENDTYSTIDNGTEFNILPTNRFVVYARRVEAESGQMASIAGAGAKMKLYLAHDGAVMGAMGNWRQVQWNGEMVSVLDKTTAWDLFVQHGMQMTISPLPVKYDSVSTDFNTATQAYYELSGTSIQTRLIPVWIFKVDYSLAGQVVLAAADTFIYASQSMAPPIAVIESPLDGASYDYPASIEFQGNVVTGFGTSPYTYHWESDLDGSLCDSNICTPAAPLAPGCYWDSNTAVLEPMPHQITLTVTDAAEQSNSDTIMLTITGGACGADLDHNGVINMADFALFAHYWLATTKYQE